jgi:NADH-quinone oxidoreductase subunit N
LAYSGISHAGYLLLAIISLRGNTESSLLYYAVGYSVSTLAAFSVAMLVFKAAGNENIDALNGLGKKNPLMAATLTMAMLSLAGIPPFAGFFGKYYIFSEGMKNGYFYLVLVAIINSIIGVFYYFKPILAMYGQPANDVDVKTNYANNLVLWICLALSLALGLFPDLIAELL